MKCPDCEKEFTEVVVVQVATKRFLINHEKEVIYPASTTMDSPNWDYDTHYYRCPHCDSLNINDEAIKDYEFEEHESDPVALHE